MVERRKTNEEVRLEEFEAVTSLKDFNKFIYDFPIDTLLKKFYSLQKEATIADVMSSISVLLRQLDRHKRASVKDNTIEEEKRRKELYQIFTSRKAEYETHLLKALSYEIARIEKLSHDGQALSDFIASSSKRVFSDVDYNFRHTIDNIYQKNVDLIKDNYLALLKTHYKDLVQSYMLYIEKAFSEYTEDFLWSYSFEDIFNVSVISRIALKNKAAALQTRLLTILTSLAVFSNRESAEEYIKNIRDIQSLEKTKLELEEKTKELDKAQKSNIAKDFHLMWNGTGKILPFYKHSNIQYLQDQASCWKKVLLPIANAIVFIVNLLKRTFICIVNFGVELANMFISLFYRGARGRDIFFQVALIVYWATWLYVIIETKTKYPFPEDITVKAFLPWLLVRLPFTVLFWVGLIFLNKRQREAHNEYLYFAHLEKMLNGMITYANSSDSNQAVKEEYIKAGMAHLTKSPLEGLSPKTVKSTLAEDLLKNISLNFTKNKSD